MKRLNELFDVDSDMAIYSIHSDSRYVKPFSLFFAVEGLTTDGHKYIGDAIFHGAKCIVHSKDLEEYQEGIYYIKVKDTIEEINRVAKIFYNDPSKKIKVIGITGTYGKSVVAWMSRHALSSFCKTGLICTNAIEYDGKVEPTPYTTPESIYLQQTFHEMENSKVKVVAMETSSHGLALRRVEGVSIDIAVLTNIYPLHLDFHGTYGEYVNAKKKLFTMLSDNGYAVINFDDEYCHQIAANCIGKIIRYGIHEPADIMAKNIEMFFDHSEFDFTYKNNVYRIVTQLVGMGNIYNLLALAGIMQAMGCDEKMVIDALENMPQVPGKYERIENPYNYRILVDHCQNLQNMEDILNFGRKMKKNGKLIVVAGAQGKRNVKWRAKIGSILNQYADYVILSQLDDRGESVESICETIQDEITKPCVIIPNRQFAIEQAVSVANKNDIVLVLGKGAEDFMSLAVGKVKYPTDKVIVENTFKELFLRRN